ncbi:hypothetical protein F2P56_027996, partial [Juglans regia]
SFPHIPPNIPKERVISSFAHLSSILFKCCPTQVIFYIDVLFLSIRIHFSFSLIFLLSYGSESLDQCTFVTLLENWLSHIYWKPYFSSPTTHCHHHSPIASLC